jgi:hypothetical protein
MRLAPVLRPGNDQQDKTFMTAGFKPASKQHQYLQLLGKSRLITDVCRFITSPG